MKFIKIERKHYFYFMKHRHLRHIIVFGSIVLAGLLIVQLYWFKKAFDVSEKQFDHSVQVALKKVADSLDEKNARQAEVKKLSSSFFFVSTNSPLDFEAVDTLIKEEFLIRELDIDYELGIYDAYDDTLVYGNYVYSTKRRLIEEEFSDKSRPIRSEENFAVFFPGKKSYLAAELNIWIFSTMVLLLMIGFFAYAIYSLLREKRFAEIKNDFINNMTHELKTPVTNIRIASEVLRSKSTGNSIYFDILEKENEKLQQKIDHVLMAASGESLHKRPFELIDIHDILTQCAETFKLRVQKRKGVIRLQFDAKNSAVAGDRELLVQTISNIIDNAEKYSPNHPEIVLRTIENTDGIEIMITDNGMGIPAGFQQRVFDKFFRVSTGNVHEVKGFGLGLSFVKNVIKAHRGKVRLASLSQGTEVNIYLPKA